MANKRIGEEGKRTRFSKDNQPENKGRKKSILNHDAVKALSFADLRTVIFDLIAKPTEELETIAEDKTQPAFISVIAGAIVSDKNKGRATTITDCLNRLYGCAK